MSATANDSCASSRPPWALGAVWHSTSGHLKGKVALPWGRGAYVGVDLCGRLQPLSQKLDCYSKHNRPHPVPPQAAVDDSLHDLFERLEFDLRENIVFLFVDGRTSWTAPGCRTSRPRRRRCCSGPSRLVLTSQRTRGSPPPIGATSETRSWRRRRPSLTTTARSLPWCKSWIVRTKRSTRVYLRVSAYESDPQIADLLKKGMMDYAVSDDSDLMCFGAEKQWSGFMNVNKKVYRRHSIFGKELNRSLGLLKPWSSSSSSSSLSSS